MEKTTSTPSSSSQSSSTCAWLYSSCGKASFSAGDEAIHANEARRASNPGAQRATSSVLSSTSASTRSSRIGRGTGYPAFQ